MADDCGLDQVAPGDAEHVAEQDVAEVLVGLDAREHDEADREHAGEDDAHGGVFLDAAVVLEIAGADRGEQPGDERADGDGQADHIGDDGARQHGVRDGVAHQRPALEHEEARQHRRDGADEDGDQQRAA